MKLNELYEEIGKQIANGNGDKIVLTTDGRLTSSEKSASSLVNIRTCVPINNKTKTS